MDMRTGQLETGCGMRFGAPVPPPGAERTPGFAAQMADASRPSRYMNALSGCMGSCEKVSGLVKDLMKVC